MLVPVEFSDSSCQERVSQASPGKNNNFHTMSPLALPLRFRVVSDFSLLSNLIQSFPAL